MKTHSANFLATLVILSALSIRTFSAAFAPEVAEGRRTVYVAVGGTGSGTSWADAMGNLQDAINLPSDGFDGLDVWLAEGVYYPDTTGFLDKRGAAFWMRNGVRIYGGFGGDEALLSERDPEGNISRLSGDFMKTEDRFDNSHCVVYAIDMDTTAIMDGIYISDGCSTGGSGQSAGSGIYMRNSKAIFRNVVLENNEAGGHGGAIYMQLSTPVFEQARFIGNRSGGMGGAVYLNESTPAFESCSFINNRVLGDFNGGAFYLHKSDASFINCILANNQAGTHGSGGAVYCYESSPLILNSMLINNYCRDEGGGMYCTTNSQPRIVNSILWSNYNIHGLNQLEGFKEEINAEISNSAVQEGNIYKIPSERYLNNIDSYPRFSRYLNVTGNSADALLADWRLLPCSPCINQGVLDTDMPDYDLDANPRVVGEMVDMGPYEFQGEAGIPLDTLVIFVMPDGTGNGSSWEEAYGDLQTALDVPLGCYLQKEIWLSEGVYIPNEAGQPFRMKSNTTLLGGFDTGMISKEERAPETFLSILSGDIGMDSDFSNNCTNVLNCNKEANLVLDGLVIERAGPGVGAIYT